MHTTFFQKKETVKSSINTGIGISQPLSDISNIKNNNNTSFTNTSRNNNLKTVTNKEMKVLGNKRNYNSFKNIDNYLYKNRSLINTNSIISASSSLYDLNKESGINKNNKSINDYFSANSKPTQDIISNRNENNQINSKVVSNTLICKENNSLSNSNISDKENDKNKNNSKKLGTTKYKQLNLTSSFIMKKNSCTSIASTYADTFNELSLVESEKHIKNNNNSSNSSKIIDLESNRQTNSASTIDIDANNSSLTLVSSFQEASKVDSFKISINNEAFLKQFLPYNTLKSKIQPLEYYESIENQILYSDNNNNNNNNAYINNSKSSRYTISLFNPNETSYHFNFIKRSIMIDFLIEIKNFIKIREETFFLSVAVLDKYLIKNNYTIDQNTLDVILVTICFICAKYEEISLPDMDDYKRILSIQNDKMISTEYSILSAFDYDFCFVTTLQVLEHQFTKVEDCFYNIDFSKFFLYLSSVYLDQFSGIDMRKVSMSILYLNFCFLMNDETSLKYILERFIKKNNSSNNRNDINNGLEVYRDMNSLLYSQENNQFSKSEILNILSENNNSDNNNYTIDKDLGLKLNYIINNNTSINISDSLFKKTTNEEIRKNLILKDFLFLLFIYSRINNISLFDTKPDCSSKNKLQNTLILISEIHSNFKIKDLYGQLDEIKLYSNQLLTCLTILELQTYEFKAQKFTQINEMKVNFFDKYCIKKSKYNDSFFKEESKLSFNGSYSLEKDNKNNNKSNNSNINKLSYLSLDKIVDLLKNNSDVVFRLNDRNLELEEKCFSGLFI